MDVTLRWLSPLEVSVVLFLLIGCLWIFIGVLTVPLHNRYSARASLFVSSPTDETYFGGDIRLLLAADPALGKLRTLLLTVIAGFLLLSGVVFISLAWFGVQAGQPWAVITLGLSGVIAEIFWALALLPYFQAAIPVTLADLPPFIWIPGFLILPACMFGWIGSAAAR